MIKKILSVLLALITIVGVIITAPILTEAKTAHSQSEAVSWIKSQIGVKLDYDNAYGAQCVDLIAYYYAYLGAASYIGGNAENYTRNTLPPGWIRTNSPQAGDICVWGAYTNPGGWNTGQYGHVGLVYAVGSGTISTVEQNLSGDGNTPCQSRTRDTSKVTCFIRPDFTTAPHTHSYNTYVYYWATHPHYKCYKCSCGEIKENKSEPYFLSSCASCKNDFGASFFAKITNPKTGLALTLADNNSNVNFQTYTGGSSQIWHFAKDSDGSYFIRCAGTNKYLDVAGGSTSNGTNVQVYNLNSSNAQRWFIATSNNGYSLISKLGNIAVDMANDGVSSGVNAQIYVWNYSAAQEITITKVNDGLLKDRATEYLGDEFNAQIYKASGGNIIGCNNSSLVLNSKDKTLWHFVKQNNSNSQAEYKIFYGKTGKCISAEKDTITGSTNLLIDDDKNKESQKWYIFKRGDIYYLSNKQNTNYVMNIESDSTKDLANVFLYDYKDWESTAQQLSFNIIENLGSAFDATMYKTNDNIPVGIKYGNVELCDESNIASLRFERQPDMTYIIIDPKTEKCLSVKDNSTELNASIIFDQYIGNDTQKWYIAKRGNGYNLISFAKPSLAMDVKSNGTEVGTNIELYTNHLYGSTAQIFSIVKATSNRLLGDVDLDGSVTITDATRIQMHLAKLKILNEDSLAAADTDSDGKVSITDATMIQLYLAKLIDKLG